MRITLVALALMGLVGCAGADGGMAGQGLDSGAMAQAETGTGGTGGAAPATGGSGGSSATGGSGGGGGTGGSSPTSDAGAPKMDAMMSADTMPTSTEPTACVSTYHIVTGVCMDPPNAKDGKVLRKDGRACNFCATYKADGRTVDKQFVGCIPAAGAICVMNCSECK